MNFTVPKTTRSKTRKLLFPQLKTSKTNFFSKFINLSIFFGRKSHSTKKVAISSPSTFFTLKTNMKVKVFREKVAQG